MTTGIPRDAKIACIKIRDMSGVVCGVWVVACGSAGRMKRREILDNSQS
jgi:hypothetical protein